MRMGSLDEFIASTRARIRHGDAKLLLIDDLFAGVYEPAAGDPPTASLSSVLPGAPNVPTGDALESPPPDPERLVILQYTSGSTSEPKGVMIPDRVLSANIDAIAAAAGLGEEVMVSWLPLYHDMGLVGFLAIPMTTGVDLVLAAPAGLPRPSGDTGCSGSRTGAARRPPGRTSRGCLATRALRRATRSRPVVVDAGPVGGRAGRPRRDGCLRRRRRAARLPAGGGVPGVRDGRGGDRRDVPTPWPGDGVRHGRPGRARARPRRQARRRRRSRRLRRQRPAPAAARPGRSRAGDPRRRPGHVRGASRAPRRRADHPRHVGHARLLPPRRRHRRAVPRRLAAHRRPGLPARRRAGPVRADQGRDHRRRAQRVPRGHRAGRRRASTACAPAT